MSHYSSISSVAGLDIYFKDDKLVGIHSGAEGEHPELDIELWENAKYNGWINYTE